MQRDSSQSSLQQKNILIIEDSRMQAAKLKYMLELHGFNVLQAANGTEAFSIIEECVPSLVISDVIMPEMDGFMVCSILREDPRTKDVPVILLTGLSNPLDIIKGLECGADNLITKPWDETRLLSMIHYIFANINTRGGEENHLEVEVLLEGERHLIKSDPVRMVSFLFHSYETAVQKNRELIKTQDELRHLSTHDVVTGLFNRTFFEVELQRLSVGRKFPVSVITADVDGLKTINDTLGHEAGERLLKLAADALVGAFRRGDVVARIGGDEFCVLLPETDETVVGKLMERIRMRLRNTNDTERDFTVSISLGAATARTAEELPDALKLSDARMYEEKFSRKLEARGEG
jgi:two-component system, cell cycle response regulator